MFIDEMNGYSWEGERGAVQRLVQFSRCARRVQLPSGDDRSACEPPDRDPGDGCDRAGPLCVGGTSGRALARLGKPAAAALIQGKLPTNKAIRSGDLGEIYATEWIDAHSGGYRAPIKRLRWKDHRNMAMRGDDVIGILQDAQTSACIS